MDHTLKKDFQYTHKNPYHDRLAAFAHFVMRDEESEANAGKWNAHVFKREGVLNVEIGTGYGHFMMEYCEDRAEENFVGLDFRFKRSYNLARKLDRHPHKNFRYLRARGERVHFIFGESEVDRLFYFFPDPWPKKRHWKKRLFQMPFLESCAKALKPGGELFIKTDHEGYADWMEEVIEEQAKKNLFSVELATRDMRGEYPEHLLSKYTTKFEKIFLKQDVKIKGFVLKNLKS